MNDDTNPIDPEDIFNCDAPGFELHSRENGFTSWSARNLAEFLGYRDYGAFFKSAVNRAQSVCLSIGVNLADHFKQEETAATGGKAVSDIRLSRFACYLCAMNGDTKKAQVAQAQAYFATFAVACQRYMEQADQIERVLVRDEISDHEKTLSSEAKQAGVTEYHFFQNAGYRGLYNMNFSRLKELKRIPKDRSPLDFMGKDELAANLFRLTQTRAKIRNEKIRGQKALEHTAETVGKAVRKTMHEISGQRPEALPREEDIRKVKTALKSTGKGLQKIDSKKPKRPALGADSPSAGS